MADEHAIRLLLRLISAAITLLIAATWPLWTPDHPWPQIPWIAAACQLSALWDWCALTLVGAGCCMLFAGHQHRRSVGAALLVIGLAAALIVDQHRLQPWALEYLLVATFFWLAPGRTGLQCVRWLVISIYTWSAVSKLDAAYLMTDGRDWLQGLLDSIGLDLPGWRQQGPQWAVLLLPMGELLVAASLAVPRLRRFGLALSLVMHGLLIWVLGPFGLRHEPAVLIWNAACIPQNWLIFRRFEVEQPATEARPISSRLRPSAAWILTAAAVILPALELIGCWDHWPAWAVYSARPADVIVLVDDAVSDRLPATLRPHVGAPEPLTDWRPVSLDQWSFDELHCPVYPQQRFRLAVAAAIGEECNLGSGLQLRIHSEPDRWTGQRSETMLSGTAAIRKACDEYWINTSPRATRWSRLDESGVPDARDDQ